MTQVKMSMEEVEKRFRKKFNIEGIDLEKEIELIKEKKSNLSSKQRDAVPFLYGMIKRHTEEIKSEC